jgi:hypothetical protein
MCTLVYNFLQFWVVAGVFILESVLLACCPFHEYIAVLEYVLMYCAHLFLKYVIKEMGCLSFMVVFM